MAMAATCQGPPFPGSCSRQIPPLPDPDACKRKKHEALKLSRNKQDLAKGQWQPADSIKDSRSMFLSALMGHEEHHDGPSMAWVVNIDNLTHTRRSICWII